MSNHLLGRPFERYGIGTMESAVHDEGTPAHGALDESGSFTGAADMAEHWRTYLGFVRELKRVVLLVAALLLGLYFGLAR